MTDNWLHIVIALSGASTLAIIAHAVNTFPTPVNKYGAWLLGVVQFAVGQRTQGAKTIEGIPNQKDIDVLEQKFK